ncbi:Pyruvate ferredoxin/flavodoxin oxidoreductase, beta subunit [Candidatus Desulfarcum epimagneticum]|uniref:Pyruvate ferredoxin/flavodoxin oxidoreductase, beta subunit n=1 Tax=uncultured Desulfobacteraceae bacterium TaxID=218296 RepID=A0A484HKY4_9BACT|nr:Pyruvate ferredoxin/flavodoxin oxidoreductase, beta subunit [uncultured Desulfobacteraceae bacterium]
MITPNDYENAYENKWCPGCGNFAILDAMKNAFAEMDIPPEEILLISGIGQAAKTPHFLRCNMFHTLHGRALPIATGAKMANHGLNIVVNAGDGDCYGEGGNHFLNAIRRNIDLTLLVHNNRIYGLTQGQASPTTRVGMVTKMQRKGVVSDAFNPVAAAISMKAGFVARGFSGAPDQLRFLIQKALEFKGLAMIDILQPCVTFNKINTFQWFKKRVYDLAETDYDPGDEIRAFEGEQTPEENIPTGIIYTNPKPSFTERIEALKDRPLVSAQRDAEKIHNLLI